MQGRTLCLLVGLLLAVFILQGCTHQGQEVEVVMRGTQFEPRVQAITVGTTVVWTNDAGFPHTTTSVDDAWDSEAMSHGESYPHTFKEPGEYRYYCAFHRAEGMTGIINVTAE